MPFLLRHGGGVTFSGGEPLFQAAFVGETIGLLAGARHLILETSGFAAPDAFDATTRLFDEIYFDLKPMDESLHRRFTGVGNAMIHRNLRSLARTGRPFTVRIPLIPGVTDTEGNLEAAAGFCADLKESMKVELMPYNELAGGKYRGLGREYAPGFDAGAAPAVDRAMTIFSSHGLEASLP